jgi:L-ascorbate metabolism protein UlaG (beta-lactamase superfamily)
VHTVSPGDHVDVAGFAVDVVGEKHAIIHPDVPQVTNVGYLVDGAVLHPGDALTVPDGDIELLLVPIAGPWVKASEVIDYVRSVRAARAVPIHDATLTDGGRTLLDGLLGDRGPGIEGTEYARVAPGETFTV